MAATLNAMAPLCSVCVCVCKGLVNWCYRASTDSRHSLVHSAVHLSLQEHWPIVLGRER